MMDLSCCDDPHTNMDDATYNFKKLHIVLTTRLGENLESVMLWGLNLPQKKNHGKKKCVMCIQH